MTTRELINELSKIPEDQLDNKASFVFSGEVYEIGFVNVVSENSYESDGTVFSEREKETLLDLNEGKNNLSWDEKVETLDELGFCMSEEDSDEYVNSFISSLVEELVPYERAGEVILEEVW